MKRKSLSTQITLWTCLLIFITAGSVVGYSAYNSRIKALEIAKENIHSLSHQEGHHLELEMYQAINVLQSMAQILGKVRDSDSPLDIPRYEATSLMKNFLENNEKFASAFICWEPETYDFLDAGYAGERGSDASGRFAPLWVRSSGGEITLRALLESSFHSPDGLPAEWYEHPQKNQKPYIGSAFYNPISQSLVSTVTVPIVQDNIFYGVVGFDLQLSVLQKKLHEAEHFKNTMHVDIIDGEGTVVASTAHPDMIGGSAKYLYRNHQYILPHVHSGSHFVDIENENLYHIYEVDFPTGNTSWIMTAVVPLSVITKDIAVLMWQQVGIFLCVLVVMVFITMKGADLILNRPLALLLGEVKRVAKGDLSHEVKMVRKDEIGAIGDAFNSMRIKLKKVLIALQKNQKELEGTVTRRTNALQMKNKLIVKSKERLQKALDEISTLIDTVVAKGGDLKESSFKHPELKECWKIMKCDQEECSCFGKGPMRCWQESDTLCNMEAQQGFDNKFETCQKCMFYKNTTSDSIYQIGEHFNNMIFILRQNNEKLEKAHQQLFHAQKLESVGQLAASIAHEINTPTQYVGTNVEFLKEAFEDYSEFMEKLINLLKTGKNNTVSPELVTEIERILEELDWEYLAEEIPETINQSKDGIKRVSSIVQAMKEFSHPGSKEKEPSDLNHILETTITVARNEWKYIADLEMDFDKNLPSVPCYSDEMSQVILNIIVNAAHAISSQLGENQEDGKGNIAISTRHDDDYAEVRISDTGGGVPEEIGNKIFDPFFTTKTVGKGTGQGLSIAHDVVSQKHDGTLTFEVEPGIGTTFIIRLPLKVVTSKQVA